MMISELEKRDEIQTISGDDLPDFLAHPKSAGFVGMRNDIIRRAEERKRGIRRTETAEHQNYQRKALLLKLRLM